MQWVETMLHNEIVKGVLPSFTNFEDLEIQLYGDEEKLAPLVNMLMND